MTTFDFNTFLQCLEGTLQNLNALIECAKDMANGGDINTFNVSNVKSKEMKEETKESTPCTPLKKVKKKAKKGAQTTFERGARARKGSLDERREAFIEELRPLVTEDTKDLCNAFFAYWTEPTSDGSNMRFEMEGTWNTAYRLSAWKRHSIQYDNVSRTGKKSNPETDTAAAERHETERCENEQRRERDRAEACPLWLVNIGRKYGLLADNPTTASLLKAVSELHRAKRLTDEEARIYEDKTNR